MNLLNRIAVVKGAATAIVVCLPLALLSNIVHDRNADSALLPVLFLAVAAGFALGGFVAARAEGDAPYTNGAFAAIGGFVVMEVISIVVRVAGDKTVHVGTIVGTALIAYAAGIIGALVAQKTGGS